QAEDGIRDFHVTGVQTCALPISGNSGRSPDATGPRFERTAALREHKAPHGHDRRQAAFSNAIAVASPPPMQRLAMPFFRSYLYMAPISVAMIRAPDAPTGWPRAQAPPWKFTLSAGRLNSFIAAMVTTAKASLIS